MRAWSGLWLARLGATFEDIHMRIRMTLLALAASVLCAPSAAGLAEFGIEGMGVVSTPANETRATVAPDGQRIVWASDRDGGMRLWQAALQGGRWSAPMALPLPGLDAPFDPFLSADGRWLYFAAGRAGHTALYRAARTADGGIGDAEPLGAAINAHGAVRSPTVSLDGTRLLFVRAAGDSAQQLLVAHWDGHAFVDPQPLPGLEPAADIRDASWLGDGRAVLVARSEPGDGAHRRLWLARCAHGRYAAAQPLAVSFNAADGITDGAVVDASKPGELLLAGSARAPRAGGRDIYRMKAPASDGDADCLPH
jgi:hypothetical protein